MGFGLDRHRALSFCLSMIFFGKPVSTFPDHALNQLTVSLRGAMLSPAASEA
jgi:hypothetical protein